MKSLFKGYYRPTEEEFEKLWDACTFTFDANILLNLYRYSESTRDVFFNILDGLKDRIWLTNQACYEFHHHRLDVINEQREAYSKIDKALTRLMEDIKKDFSRHPHIAIKELDKKFRSISKYLDELSRKHPDHAKDDNILSRLSELFEGKVGTPYPPADLEKKYKEAEKRYQKRIPPGYKDDKDKLDPEKYGDAIIWFQIIDYAKANSKPIIFVTDDTKEDWWRGSSDGKTIGPRPELIQEMQREAEIQFYMYKGDRFIEYAQQHLDLKPEPKAVKEVKTVREEEERRREEPLTISRTYEVVPATTTFSIPYTPSSGFAFAPGTVPSGTTFLTSLSSVSSPNITIGQCSKCKNNDALRQCSICLRYFCSNCIELSSTPFSNYFLPVCEQCRSKPEIVIKR